MKYIDFQEFIDFGYLQELNRRFLHPLGLALGLGPDGTCKIADCRDDLEGIIYTEGLSYDKARRVINEELNRDVERLRRLGYIVQPVFDNEPMR
jgi:hypothetical protein